MMYHPGGTIRETLRRIEQNQYVLPAIQREFVWSPDQICALFDSLLQGYPFGEFLFWQIDSEHSAEYRYYGFVLDYHQRDNPHCPEARIMPGRPITAVLDGQQRLTAFNIGLRGSMAVKRPYKCGLARMRFPAAYWRWIYWHRPNRMKKETATLSSSLKKLELDAKTDGCGLKSPTF